MRVGWVDPLFVPAPSAVRARCRGDRPGGPGGSSARPSRRRWSPTRSRSRSASGAASVDRRRALPPRRPEPVPGRALRAPEDPGPALDPARLRARPSTPAVVYGVLQGFFPICLLVAGGVRDIDRTPLRVARSMGATSWQIYRKVILPAVLPAVLAGMRLGIVFCLLGVLVVEMFGGIRGMGFLLATPRERVRRAGAVRRDGAGLGPLGRRRPGARAPEPAPRPLALAGDKRRQGKTRLALRSACGRATPGRA